MSTNFCGNCGEKFTEQVNFCPSCGHVINGKASKEKILSVNDTTKINIFNLVGFLLIGAYSVQYFIQLYLYGLKWEKTTNLVVDSAENDDMFIFVLNFCLFILLIIIFSIFFKKTFVSKVFVQVTFLTSLFSVITFSLHMLYTAFLYVNIQKGIKVIYGYHNEFAEEVVREILKYKLGLLAVVLFFVTLFVFIILRRYFKSQSINKFSEGIKSLVGKPFQMDQLTNAFKKFE